MAVNTSFWTYAVRFLNDRSTGLTNYGSSIVSSGSSSFNYGESILAESNNSGQYSIGLYVVGRNGTYANYGAQIRGSGNSDENYGLYTEASGSASNNYGIYAYANGGTNNYAGFFNGALYASSYLNLPSDIKLKTNIQPIANSIDLINQLQPKSFSFNAASFPQLNLPAGIQYGMIAQDVQTILPNTVKNMVQPAIYDSLGNLIYDSVHVKSLNYEAFIPILIQGVKDLSLLNKQKDSLISSLNDRLSTLESIVTVCCSTNVKTSSQNIHEVELSNGDAVVLNQNAPNPFAEQTVITYSIPAGTGFAQILFFDKSGRMIKAVDITEKGKGLLKVYAADLSTGTYTYSLIIDGKVADSKQMVKMK
jgi:hypothetical protein